MTSLRDARLGKALEHAPDADARPALATRAAILLRARQAVEPAAMLTPAVVVAHAAVMVTHAAVTPPPVAEPRAGVASIPWWRRLWSGAGGATGRPWNAAFASLLLASVITGLWWDREVPDARLDSSAKPAADQPIAGNAPKAQADAAVAPSAPTPMDRAAAPPAPAPSSKASATPPASATEGTSPATAGDSAPATKDAREARKSPEAKPTVRQGEEEAVRARKEHAPTGQTAEAPATRDRNTPAPVPVPVPVPVPTPTPAPAQAKATAPPPVPAAEPAPVAAAMPAPASAAATVEPEFTRWTEIRIVLPDDRVRVVPRGQADASIASAISSMVRGAGSPQPLGERASIRIELSRDGVDIGVLELGDRVVRWTAAASRSSASRSVTGQPDVSQLQALREALMRGP